MTIDLLSRLVEQEGLAPGSFAFFFTSTEGHEFNGVEETSGFVLASDGRCFEFWMGPDKSGAPSLMLWEECTIEPGWENAREYQEARLKLGIVVASLPPTFPTSP